MLSDRPFSWFKIWMGFMGYLIASEFYGPEPPVRRDHLVREGPFGLTLRNFGNSFVIWWSNTRFNKHNFGKFREKKWFQISGENVILTVSRNKQGVVESNKQIRSIIDLPLRVILIWNARGLHGGFMTTITSPNESKTSENPGFWLDENSFRWFYYKRAREWIILLIQKNSRRPLKHFFGE